MSGEWVARQMMGIVEKGEEAEEEDEVVVAVAVAVALALAAD